MLKFTKARRALLLTVAGAVVAASSIIPATTAVADDDCYVQLDAPSKIAITSPYRDVSVRLIDSCGIADYASFYDYGSEGMDNIFIFDGNTSDHWDVYDGYQTTGTFNTRLGGAWDADYNDIAFRSTRTVVKFGSRASVSTSRSGKKVTIKVSSTSYSADTNRFTGWNGSSPAIQYKSGTTWKTLKTVKLKGGKASYTYTSTAKREYRFVTKDSSNRFGATSGASRR